MRTKGSFCLNFNTPLPFPTSPSLSLPHFSSSASSFFSCLSSRMGFASKVVSPWTTGFSFSSSFCASRSSAEGGFSKKGMLPRYQSMIMDLHTLLTSGSPPFSSLPVFSATYPMKSSAFTHECTPKMSVMCFVATLSRIG